MTEKRVNIFAYEENVPEDINNLQTYVQDSLDHVVFDAIMIDPRFTGFVTGKSAPIEVTVQPGRYYREGRVYAKHDTQQFNFVANLPITGKRIAVISVWGREIQTDPTPRNVLIAASSTPTNPVYQPQILEKTQMREAVLGVTFSSEAPDPSVPVIEASMLPVAKVLLNNTGVEAVEMYLDNILLNLAEFDGSLDSFLLFQKYAAQRLDSLTSDVAGIWNELRKIGRGDKELLARMLARVAILESNSGIPSLAADSSADFFLDPHHSDITNALSDCIVSEGVRFAHDGQNVTPVALFNPIDPNVTLNNGMIFPAYEAHQRFVTGTMTGQQLISAYQYNTQHLEEKTVSRTRIRWGGSMSVCTNSAFWQSGHYDAVSQTFTRNGETFRVEILQYHQGRQDYFTSRLTQFWIDTWEEPYWDLIINKHTIQGASLAESFYVGQDYWLSGVSLQFVTLDATNPVSIVLCECEDTGEPNVKKSLAHTTLTRANLTVGKTRFNFAKPVFMSAGKRYAVWITSPGNHEVATCPGTSFNEGMYFGVTGGYPVPDPSRHIVIDFYSCRFKSNTSYIDLQGLQLVGGITDIDILTGAVVPAAAKMTFQVQASGVWLSLDAVTAGMLNAGGSLPPLLPFRVVFSGTHDCMPAIDTTTSQVTVSRPKKSWNHIWPAQPRTPPAPSDEIRCMIRYESYDANHHTVGAKLADTANIGAAIAPTSWTDSVPEPGVLERTYVWNTAAPIPSYKIVTEGRTDTVLATFHIAWLKDWVM